MRQLYLFLILALLNLSTAAVADFLGATAKIGQWRPDFSGVVTTENVDINDSLGLDDDKSLYISASIEHPIPIIPNFKIAHTGIEEAGEGVLEVSFEFGGRNFSVDEPVTTEIDLTHTDFTLYYEIIDIGFDLDLGLTARKFDGDLKVTSDVLSANEPIDYWVPMGYLAARIGIPLSGLYVTGYINGLAYSGNSLVDFSIAGGWEMAIAPTLELGVEVGYRKMSLELEEEDVGEFDSDVDIDGIFANVVAKF